MRDFDKDPKECACRDWAYTSRHTYTPGSHHPTCPMAHDSRTCICHWCRRLRGDPEQMPRQIMAERVSDPNVFHIPKEKFEDLSGELLKYKFKADWDKEDE